MPGDSSTTGDRLEIHSRLHWRDLLTFAGGLFLTAGSLLALIRPDSWSTLIFGAVGVCLFTPLPVLNGYYLARGATVAVMTGEGIALYDETYPGLRRRSRSATVKARWAEVARVVLWHRTVEERGVKYRVACLGIDLIEEPEEGPAADRERGRSGSGGRALTYHELQQLKQAQALVRALGSGDQSEGVPDQIGTAVTRQSVVFGASGRAEVVSALGRFAPHVEFVDVRKSKRPSRMPAASQQPGKH